MARPLSLRWPQVLAWRARRSHLGTPSADGMVEAELVPVDVEGATAYLTEAGAADIVRRRSRRAVRLLPAFDPYVVGVLAHLERLLPDATLRRRVSRTAGWISPTVTVDGAVLGVWRHDRRRRGVEIALEEFVDLGKVAGRLAREVRSTAELMHAWPDGTDDAGDAPGPD